MRFRGNLSDIMKKDQSSKIPQHVAIIMDGNGRWAQARKLPRLAGHRAGVENLRRILRAAVELHVPILTIYAFSTENWDRPPDEVEGLMNILQDVIDQELEDLHQNGVQLRHLGCLEQLNPVLQEKVRAAVELTRNNSTLHLNIAWNYGGRDEILHAVKAMLRDAPPPEDVTEELFSSYLYTAGLPDPDLIIRTSGEMRVSNFLVWQGAYAEYYVTDTLWPDFDKEAFRKALEVYAARDRRFGRVNLS